MFNERVWILSALFLLAFRGCKSESTTTNESIDLSTVRELIRGLRSSSGDVDVSSLLTENVPDPVPLEDFNISNSGFLSDIRGQFRNLQLHGLRGFQADALALNLAKNNLSAIFSVPLLSIMGDYHLEGSVTFFPLSGAGPFYMNLSDILLKGHSILHPTPEGRLVTGKVHLESEVGEMALHFEHLLGGGTWGSLSNSLLNQLSELLLGELKPSLLRELAHYLKQQLDDEVFRHLPNGFFQSEGATSLMDALIDRAAPLLPEPMQLPPFTQVYERNLLWVRTRSELELNNGSLYGLHTLTRSDDVFTEFANNSLVFRANFQFENITGEYDWRAAAFGTHTTGKLHIQVKSVSGFIRVTQKLRSGSNLELEDFHIKNIGHVWLDLQGLSSTWDYLAESIINLLTNGLKLQLADAIAGPAQEAMRQQLHTINIGFQDE